MARRLQVLQGHLQQGNGAGVGQVHQLSSFRAGPHLVREPALAAPVRAHRAAIARRIGGPTPAHCAHTAQTNANGSMTIDRQKPTNPTRPRALQVEYDADCGGLDTAIARAVLTSGALAFVAELVHEFREGVVDVSRR